MGEIKDDMSHHHSLIVSEPQVVDEMPQRTKRLASLDVFRGLTVALMILVDDAGGEWPMIAHAPWHGCNLADFVMPFFLFIVGLAIALALKRVPNQHDAMRKVILRTVKLLFWGILLQGGFSHAPANLTYGVDINKIRWCGILQRIALSYIVVALLEIFTKDARVNEAGHISIFKLYFWHWLVGACVVTVYAAVLYGTFVPNWQFIIHDFKSADYGKIVTVDCGVRGKLDPPCNAVGYVDRKVLGINHIYQHPAWKRSEACTGNSPYEGLFLVDAPSWCWGPFEPEGILSSISAIISTLIGLHFGHVLIHFKDHSNRLRHWVVMGLSLLLLGVLLHFTAAIPINKQLYTISYVSVTSGAAALVFSAFYVLVALSFLKYILLLYQCTVQSTRENLDKVLRGKIPSFTYPPDSNFPTSVATLTKVDIWNLRNLFLPLEWIGMNAMLVYVMAAAGIFAGFVNGWYYNDPHNTLIRWIKKHIFIGVWHSRRVGILLYVLFAEILFWGIIAGIFHRYGIYWKL